MRIPTFNLYGFRGTILPLDLQESIDRYVRNRVPTGDFLRACLCNNLSEAVCRADDHNLALLPVIASYLLAKVPVNCWGSKQIVDSWLARGRMPDDDEHDIPDITNTEDEVG